MFHEELDLGYRFESQPSPLFLVAIARASHSTAGHGHVLGRTPPHSHDVLNIGSDTYLSLRVDMMY